MTKIFVTAIAVGALSTAGLVAQESRPQRDRDVDVDVQVAPERQAGERTAGEAGPFGRLDPKTSGRSVRASQLIGMNVVSRSNESLGDVNDLLIDAESGRIRYAALSFGGVLGIGDKLFAVPWQMFQAQPDPEDPDEFRLVLNVEEEALRNAPGFDQQQWPNMADKPFFNQIDEYYSKLHRTPPRGAARPNPSDGEVDR